MIECLSYLLYVLLHMKWYMYNMLQYPSTRPLVTRPGWCASQCVMKAAAHCVPSRFSIYHYSRGFRSFSPHPPLSQLQPPKMPQQSPGCREFEFACMCVNVRAVAHFRFMCVLLRYRVDAEEARNTNKHTHKRQTRCQQTNGELYTDKKKERRKISA